MYRRRVGYVVKGIILETKVVEAGDIILLIYRFVCFDGIY